MNIIRLSCLIVFFSEISTVQSIKTESTFRHLSCQPKRIEISFPEIKDTSVLPKSNSFGNFLKVFLSWRRKRMSILLFQNTDLFSSSFMEWTEGNTTVKETIRNGCYYYGYVRGQRTSYAALSACHGLTGYIQTDEELIFVQTSSKEDHKGRFPHLLYTCEPQTKNSHSIVNKNTGARNMRRRRRSTQPSKYLEVMVAVDHSLINAIGSRDKTRDYVMDLMNIANTVYQHHTLGVDIRVAVVKIIFLEKSQQSQVLKRNDAFTTVNKFCAWSQRQVTPGRPMDYDISVLITKETLGPSGYAPITGLCNPTRSCAAIHDEGFTTGFVIAHETAHVFGLFHDGHGNQCYGRKYDSSMMAPLVESKLNHFWWSECSKRRMKEMIRYLHCLDNVPTPVKKHFTIEADEKLDPKLGKSWSLDFQCRMEFGSRFRLCSAFYSDPCSTLWCSIGRSHMCRTKRGPPLTGSNCGRDRVCRYQRCQYIGHMRPVNGNWGSWSSWTECSTECGVGMRQRSRTCDNPPQQYDGEDCSGKSDEWDTCANNTCETFQDIRAGECAIWDSLQIRYGTHKWQPFENKNKTMKCKQTCQSFYTGEIVTIDVDVSEGAPCGYTNNNSNICIAGKCVVVGCDGRMNSTKKYDMCGVCGGDGSECKLVQGSVFKQAKEGNSYDEAILTIPGNARDIRIIKTTNTSHFLALKDPRYSKHLLNGNKKQSKSKGVVINGAMIFYFKGNKTIAESISSPGPLLARLELEIFPKGSRKVYNISYSYIVHKSDFTLEKNTYEWKFDKWSDCSATCGEGEQVLTYTCRHKLTDEKVSSENCRFLKAPRRDRVKCSRERCGHIKYNYAMVNDFSPCNATCDDDGVQHQKYKCERTFLQNHKREFVSLALCAHLQTPLYKRKCKGRPCQLTVPDSGVLDWHESKEYLPCDADCGRQGKEVALLVCRRHIMRETGNVYEATDDHLCNNLTKPEASIRNCTGQPCENNTSTVYYEWHATEKWTSCNASCERSGFETKVYQCLKIEHNRTSNKMPEAYCHPSIPPNETRKCKGDLCRQEWLLGQWSECSATCGDGKRHRDVYCGDRSSKSDIIRCTLKRPKTSEKCILPLCTSKVLCQDRYAHCEKYRRLTQRCLRKSFRRYCCGTCSKL